MLVTDDIIDILTNQFRVKRAHHRERLWKVSEYEKIENVKIHLFCIIQLYILGVLYENMNTSIKYVLQAKVTMKSSKFIVTFKNDVHMGWIIFLRPVL